VGGARGGAGQILDGFALQLLRMKYKASITEDDIKNGDPLDCWNCAAARAISRALGISVSVGLVFFTLLDGTGRFGRLPRSAQRFIRRYVDGLHVEPTSFYVEV